MICASKDSVRDIMLGAEEIGVLNTGQYVFLNLGNVNFFLMKIEDLVKL